MDRQEREVRFLEVGAGGFFGIGERRFLVPVEAVTRVSEDRVTVEPYTKKKADGPTPFDTKVRPPVRRRAEELRPCLAAVRATPRAPPTPGATSTPDPRSAGSTGRKKVPMEAITRPVSRPEASVVKNPDAVWGFGGGMAKDILPEGPTERRRRSRLCALRAMDRLGLLGEGNLLAALAARPRLRWLADEEGARWAVLAELGRIGDPVAFEEAVEWALQNRPGPEEAAAHVRRLRSGAERSAPS